MTALSSFGGDSVSRFERWLPKLHFLYMKIAEPRVTRLLQLGIYISLFAAGVGILWEPPANFKDILGLSLVVMFGGFVALGGLLGSIAVLPGIWWLERVALLALSTGMCMYIVILIGLKPSPVGFAMAAAFILTFIIRWRDIRGFQLAPRER